MRAFERLLSLKYSEVYEKYPHLHSINTARKTITLKNLSIGESISSRSDILVFYDLLEDSTPLLVIERIAKADVSLRNLRRSVKDLDKNLSDYTVSYNLSKDKKFYDVLVLRETLYSRL